MRTVRWLAIVNSVYASVLGQCLAWGVLVDGDGRYLFALLLGELGVSLVMWFMWFIFSMMQDS
jgi:hypothetical protein